MKKGNTNALSKETRFPFSMTKWENGKGGNRHKQKIEKNLEKNRER